MPQGKAPQKPLKYRLKKKTEDGLDFEESSPFFSDSNEKILWNFDQINFYSKSAILIVFLLIGLLVFQTFKLQIVDRNKFEKLAEGNRAKEVAFRADRGIIYDKNKNILVKNKAIFDVVAIPKEIPENQEKINQIINELSSITGRDKAEISRNLEKIDRTSYKPKLIIDNIASSDAILIETLRDKMPGFEVKNNAIREYPDSKYFSNIIGYMGRVAQKDIDYDSDCEMSDFIGKEGLELYYEKYLRGKKGKEITEIDSAGKTISMLDKIETKTGDNLVLSLDSNLQKKLYDILDETAKKIKIKEKNNGAAAAVAIDPRNGKILALVSLPAYDNNIFADPAGNNKISALFQNPQSPMLNRAISGTYPPGSTIKPVMSVAALSEKIITKNTIIEDRGVISIPNPFFPDKPSNYYGWNRSGLGPMNVISAIAQSSDIFFYTIGGGYGNFKGLGADKIAEYFKKFNLGAKLGIDLFGEAEGIVPTKEWKLSKIGEEWNLGNTYHISIGQGYLLATPLQVASWTAAIANKGVIYKPYLVERIISSEDGTVTKEFNSAVINNEIADEKYINIAREGMREVVASGSARALNNLNFKTAGKTGTAEIGIGGKAHAWFTVFAPYDNPEIVLTILIEEGGEGGINAVPVAKDVLSWYFDGKN